ncbi:alpha-L-iduronidase [Octopus sinensis]|uniref:Alpha-L-iduronidase n=1 Tax=Octopus sinensis TaxID=2607531 RepID=A0A6P7U1D9_9MOLL|nr:alpha-L-iduronidase [Octopus sinensis]
MRLCYILCFIWPHVFGTRFVRIDSRNSGGPLKHFWRSTGFCPSKPHAKAYKYDTGSDMNQNLAYIGALPFTGIQQVRIHWLLDLVQVTKQHPLQYDFHWLDQLIDKLYKNGLKPGFELMGSLSNFFTDFENKTQVVFWRDLVKATAERYIKKYGIDYVRRWNFETWNEPDCHDFDAVNMTVKGFLNYYDASSEGLRAADKRLIFGGPGDGCFYKKHHKGHKKYAIGLLDHVVHGTNLFTGNRETRIDFISWHLKGDGMANRILKLEKRLSEEIYTKYPSLRSKPFYNDEGDPLVGWSKPRLWRADVTYAALVVKVIALHQQRKFLKHINFTLLSNDNAFLSYYPHQFTQRTLLARFQMNNTKPPHVQFVHKPVYSAMMLLAYLGDRKLYVNITKHHVYNISTHDFGGIGSIHYPVASAVSDSFQVCLLLYNATDPGPGELEERNIKQDGESVEVKIFIDPPVSQSRDLYMIIFKINNSYGNPFMLWKKMGKPSYPTKEQFHAMRQQEGPNVIDKSAVKPGIITVKLQSFVAPALLLVHICSKAPHPPGQVSAVQVYKVTFGQVLVVWSDKFIGTKCILRYEVELSKSDTESQYRRINQQDSVVNSFMFVPSGNNSTLVTGYYRVRAVDYWNRPGQYSKPFYYPS